MIDTQLVMEHLELLLDIAKDELSPEIYNEVELSVKTIEVLLNG